MKAADARTHARSGVTVTALGLGCAQMGGLYRATSLAEAAGAFRAAWERGIRSASPARSAASAPC
jgi:D-threo-aldose 1-dehydrogenase